MAFCLLLSSVSSYLRCFTLFGTTVFHTRNVHTILALREKQRSKICPDCLKNMTFSFTVKISLTCLASFEAASLWEVLTKFKAREGKDCGYGIKLWLRCYVVVQLKVLQWLQVCDEGARVLHLLYSHDRYFTAHTHWTQIGNKGIVQYAFNARNSVLLVSVTHINTN